MRYLLRFLITSLLFIPSIYLSGQSYLFGSLQTPIDLLNWTPVGVATLGDTPGDADLLPNEVLLTQNVGNSIGAIYYSTPINFAQCTGWRVEFEFRIFDGTGPYNLFGDGIAFWVTPNPPSSFANGTALGIGNTMLGLKVGFDTFDAGCGSSLNPEIQIRNGAGYDECWGQPTRNNNAGDLGFIRSNNYNTAVITYNLGNVSVTINGTQYLTGYSPISFSSAYFGFSASTGALWDLHSVRNIRIYTEQVPSNAGADVAYCSGSTTTIGAPTTVGHVYSWTPSTGLSSTTVSNPTVSLTNNTTAPITQQYIVSTLTSLAGSCPTYDTVVVTVNPQPQSNFNLSPSSVCEGSPVQVTSNNPPIAGMVYNWSFDGATINSGSGAGPYSLTWSGQANHTVSLTTTANGCTSTVNNQNVQVYQIPTPLFTISDSTLCQFDSAVVTYTGNATAGATYNWNYGNGIVQSGSNQGPITIDYNGSGNTSISLQVSENGCTSSVKTIPIVVSPRPFANFTISDILGCTGTNYAVTFIGLGPAGSTYNWNFNNGVVVNGSGAGPYNITFPNQGMQYVELEVDNNGCTSTLYQDSIQIYTTPTSDFSLSDLGICEDESLTVNYIGNAGHTATYNWNFSGGIINSGSGQGPYNVTWPSGGSPSLTLVVTENGCVSSLYTQQIIVTPKPIATFQMDNSLCEYESTSLTFTGQSNAGSIFNWNFAPATILSGTYSGPYNLMYQNDGNYQVSLFIDDNGCISDTVLLDITVNPKPDAGFTGTNLVGCEPLTSSFAANVIDPNNNYNWDFESFTGTGDSPTATFNAGTYDVELIVTTPDGCRDTSLQVNYVNAYNMPISYFNVNNTQLSGSNATLNVNDGSSFANTYLYTFGDGFISTDPSPSHTYSAEGEWLVTQIVTSINGCIDSSSVIVTFEPSPLIFIPNSFTPSRQDNKNDTWRISMSYIKNFKLMVFNRWGEIIFTSYDLFHQWDGTSKGSKEIVPIGTYAYRIMYTDMEGVSKDIIGSVNVIK